MNEAELLFTQALVCDRAALYLNKGKYLNSGQVAFVSAALKRRIKGEPIQYILGKTEFMGLEFRVDKNVLIPRPETEILVETAIKIGYRLWVIGHRLKILDIGTGCGNIAISIARNLLYCEMDAIDISDNTLEVALLNARLNNAKVNFIQSDLFNTYNLQPNTYDLIVSNPPYIPSVEIRGLGPELKYEPLIALNGGRDGLEFYRRIIKEAPDYLKDNGILIMEMGFGQARAIENIFAESGNFKIFKIVKDYSNIERVIIAEKGRKKWIS